MDVINLWAEKPRDLTSVGKGNSTLDDLLSIVATREDQGADRRRRSPSRKRAHVLPLRPLRVRQAGRARAQCQGRDDLCGKPESYGQTKRNEYTTNDYHKPSDEVKPDWDLSGAVEDARMLFEVGDRVARAKTYPEWSPGAEFRARREAMLKKAGR